MQDISEIVLAHNAVINQVARRYFPQATDVDTVKQEVTTHLLKTPTTLMPGRNVDAYISTIAKHVCIDMLRKRQQEHLVQLTEGMLEEHSWDRRTGKKMEEPEKALAQREMKQLLYHKLRQLPSIHREALIHAYGLGKATRPESYPELATRFNIPVGTVKSRISEAKKKLAELLGTGFWE